MLLGVVAFEWHVGHKAKFYLLKGKRRTEFLQAGEYGIKRS